MFRFGCLINASLQSCTLDILQNLPRSAFSDNQLEVLSWMLRVNGVDDVPSKAQQKDAQDEFRESHGVQSKKYSGALGHTYYVNSLGAIISQVSQALACLRFINI